MNDAAVHEEQDSYLGAPHGLASWLLTKDHKRIAMLYLISVTIFFALGGVFAAMIRAELVTPEGDLLTSDMYNKVFTLHGVIMIFFFLLPSIPATMGNFFMPIMIGAKDLAFPRINLLSWYIYVVGAIFTLVALFNGGVDTGWTFYTPYSSIGSNTNVTTAALGVFIAGFSSILTGLNFIVTVHRMRAPGMTWFRLPLFVWGHYATSLVMILGTPVVAITVLLVGAERSLHLGIFDARIGGDPVLFQHLFWFYSHPAVYIMILPGMSVISELVPAVSRKQIFGYSFIAFSTLAIAIIGFLVWGHHMFVTSQSIYAGLVFSIITMLVAVPSAVKTFNWAATMYKGAVAWTSITFWVIGFMGLFLIGGLTGLFLGAMGLDIHLTDTYFVVAHFHYIMVGGAIMGFFGGLHFWWPKMTGKMYPEPWAKVASMLVFFGFNLTFLPQFVVGYIGMPRRYHAYPEEFQIFNVLSTAGATVLAAGYTMIFAYLVGSLFWGKRAPMNPWGAKGLEWTIASPPTTFNFTEMPVVTEPAYYYLNAPAPQASPDDEVKKHV
jgi:cytochrome c oxidase subunit 1